MLSLENQVLNGINEHRMEASSTVTFTGLLGEKKKLSISLDFKRSKVKIFKSSL